MSKIKSSFFLLRPKQWVKNILCFAGMFFADHLDVPSLIFACGVAFFFCMASSTVYVFNDIIDREKDRLHPRKKFRPIASGNVSIPVAISICIFLFLITTVGGYLFHREVFVCLALYLANNLFYSLWLKNKSLVDVMMIAFGFMLRLYAGVYVLDEKPTVWFSLCTFFLTLLFGFSKRRSELVATHSDDSGQRVALRSYSLPYLDSLINTASAMTVISYGLFSTSYEKNPNIILTLPIVYYAVMRYKRNIMVPDTDRSKLGEEPEKVMFSPLNLFLTAVWLAVYYVTSHDMISILR